MTKLTELITSQKDGRSSKPHLSSQDIVYRKKEHQKGGGGKFSLQKYREVDAIVHVLF